MNNTSSSSIYFHVKIVKSVHWCHQIGSQKFSALLLNRTNCNIFSSRLLAHIPFFVSARLEYFIGILLRLIYALMDCNLFLDVSVHFYRVCRCCIAIKSHQKSKQINSLIIWSTYTCAWYDSSMEHSVDEYKLSFGPPPQPPPPSPLTPGKSPKCATQRMNRALYERVTFVYFSNSISVLLGIMFMIRNKA